MSWVHLLIPLLFVLLLPMGVVYGGERDLDDRDRRGWFPGSRR